MTIDQSQIWQEIESVEADFDKEHFIKVTNQWIFEPELISKLVIRGEVSISQEANAETVINAYRRKLIPRSKRDAALHESIQIIETKEGTVLLCI